MRILNFRKLITKLYNDQGTTTAVSPTTAVVGTRVLVVPGCSIHIKLAPRWRPKLRGGHVEAIIIGAKCAPRGGQNESHDGSNVTQDRPCGHDWFVWSIPIGKVTHRRFP
jgi:hypothetical protein